MTTTIHAGHAVLVGLGAFTGLWLVMFGAPTARWPRRHLGK